MSLNVPYEIIDCVARFLPPKDALNVFKTNTCLYSMLGAYKKSMSKKLPALRHKEVMYDFMTVYHLWERDEKYLDYTNQRNEITQLIRSIESMFN
jgi:hypothetical protein